MSKAPREVMHPVLPGDRLGVVEEFLPGLGTYEESGTIYANFTGTAKVDNKNKRVTVTPTTRIPNLPKDGATVMASVIHAQEKMATVSIWKIDDKTIYNPFTAILHISSASPRYERSMSEVCKAGDILRARVIDMTNRIPQLTTAGRGLGVVKASCSKCGGNLAFENGRLQCVTCGNTERRRYADDYGKYVQ